MVSIASAFACRRLAKFLLWLPVASRQTTAKSEFPGMMFALAALAALAFIIYAPAIKGPFIWDDAIMVSNNSLVRAPDGLLGIWSGKDVDYLPLTSTVFWFEWRFFGDNPGGYRVLNLLLHAGSSFLIWRILRRLKLPGAGIAAAIFCVHPVCVGTVAWVAELKNTLSTFLALASVLLFLRARPVLNGPKAVGWDNAIYTCALLAFAGALLSKISVVMLPFGLLAMVGWRKRADLARMAPFFLLSLAAGLAGIWFQHHRAMVSVEAGEIAPFMTRVLGGGYALWFYTGKILLPINLMPIYPHWEIDLKNFLTWLPLLLWLVWLAVLWGLRRNTVVGKIPFYGFLFFTVMAIPVLGVIPISYLLQTQVADHLQYFPMIGLVAVIGLVVHQLVRACSSARSAKGQGDAFNLGVVTVCLTCALAAGSFARARLFANPEMLWRDNARKNPAAPMAWANLADAVMRRGDYDEAIRLYRESIKLDPGNSNVHEDFAQLLNAVGRPDDAEAELRAVLQRQPNSAHVHNNIGTLLFATGRLPEAVAEYQAALKIAPDNSQTHINLGNAYGRVGRHDESIAQFKEALRLDPQNAQAQASLEQAQQSKNAGIKR